MDLGIIMRTKNNQMIVYKLSGRSLEAALRLDKELERELQTVPVLRKGFATDIRKSWEALYKSLIARLETEAPDVLELAGLKARAVQVFQGVQSLPRAYAATPEIFCDGRKEPEYFMYVPVDYKGGHFVPADAVLLNDAEENAAGNRLFAGGWLGNAPLVSIEKQGIATPADYEPKSQSALRKAFPYIKNDNVCFIAEGRSLAAVEDLKARKAEWQDRIDAARDAIEAIVERQKPEILARLPADEDINISIPYRYCAGEKPTLLLSVRKAGKVDLWSAGKPVPLSPSAAYDLGDYEGGEYVVKARKDTPEGRKLAALIDAIPVTPDLCDYPELHARFAMKKDDIGRALGLNGVVPQMMEISGLTLLIYNAAPDAKKDDFCPPDAKPLPAFAYWWLRNDQEDRNTGATPPPMPQAVRDALDGKTQDPKPRRKKKPPQP